MEISIVASHAENGVLNGSLGIPCHFDKGFEVFKRVTSCSPVVIGEELFRTLVNRGPSSFECRLFIVLTKNEIRDSVPESFPPVCTFSTVSDILRFVYQQSFPEVFVAGGGDVYSSFLPLATKMHITLVRENSIGADYFVDWDESSWKTVIGKRIFGDWEYLLYERV